ncbi:hypothetical protein AAVH_18961 [Aphelenchoides avenae]|nr:hypothetical protein AAVH_18961 [Aphelenchus avenae]
MTSFILILTLLTYFASLTETFVLKALEQSRDDVSGSLSPLVVPLYISQYTGYRGSSVSFPEEYYQLTIGVGKRAVLLQ